MCLLGEKSEKYEKAVRSPFIKKVGKRLDVKPEEIKKMKTEQIKKGETFVFIISSGRSRQRIV